MYSPPLNKTLVTVRVKDAYDVKTIGDLFHMAGCNVFEVNGESPNLKVRGRIANSEVNTLTANINVINEQACTLVVEIM